MIKKILIIVIILGSLNVYNISALGSIGGLMNYAAIVLMIFILIINQVYFKTRMMKRHFRIMVYLVFLAVFISMFTAYFSFRQSFLVTFFAQRNVYFYLFYFTLHVLKPGKQEFQRLIIFMGFLYFAAYMVQFLAFPTELFDVTIREERGTIRVYLEGAGYAMISYFMCLQIFYTTNKFRYLFLSVIFLIPIVLFGVRSGLLTIMIGTFAQLIFSKRIKSKPLIIFLVLLALVPTFFFFKDVIDGLVNATKIESAQGTENVRILAMQYFLTKFLPNDLSFFTGLGAPSERSALGQLTTQLSETYGYYLTDIGIIGNYVTYGALFVLAVLLITYKIMFVKIKYDMAFVKYFFFFEVFLMLPIAAGFAFSSTIVTICSCLYLADLSNHEKNSAWDSLESEVENPPEPVLQQ